MINYALIYFAVINVLGCIVNIADKNKAKRGKWRVKESTLWLIGILGGAPLSYLTMKAIRHKTQHTSFMVIMPILAVLQIAGFIFICTKYFMGG